MIVRDVSFSVEIGFSIKSELRSCHSSHSDTPRAVAEVVNDRQGGELLC